MSDLAEPLNEIARRELTNCWSRTSVCGRRFDWPACATTCNRSPLWPDVLGIFVLLPTT